MTEKVDFSNRVRKYRERHGLSQEQMAKVLGVSRNYVSMMEGGRNPSKSIERVMSMLENESSSQPKYGKPRPETGIVREDPAQGNAGELVQVRRIPVIGWVQAGELTDYDDVVDWDATIYTDLRDPKAFAVRVRGDSMAPQIPEGAVAVITPSEKPYSEQLVIARLKDEGVVIKKLQIIDAAQKTMRLISLNPHYAPIERGEDSFLWIYPVKQIVHTF